MKYKRGDIIYVYLKEQPGSVQTGVRPCLVLQNNAGNVFSSTTIVAIITKKNKRNMKTHVKIEPSLQNGLKQESFIILEQIQTISLKQISNTRGKLETKCMDRVDKAIKISLGLVAD